MSYLDDPVYQAVDTLRDPGRCVPILGRILPAWRTGSSAVDLRVLYLNYKPFERARMALSIDAVDAPELVLEVDRRPPRIGDGTAGAAGASGFALVELGAHGWTLDSAPRLEPVSMLRDPHTLRRLAGRELGLAPGPIDVDLVRYVPGKRAVLTIAQRDGTGRIYAKVARAQDAGTLAACFETVDRVGRTGAFAFRVPTVLSCQPDLQTVFLSEVPGRPFTAVMSGADTEPFTAVGAALASLHRSGVRPAAVWTTGHQLDDLRRHLAGMGRALPWLGGRIDALVARLSALEPEPFEGRGRPIHGNLFGDQILWDGAGIGIVDWDRLAWGDPLYDVGRLLAHQIYVAALNGHAPDAVRACSNALMRSFVHRANCRIDQSRLAWHVAVELLLRAKISALRPLAADWPEHCARAVAECERLIDGTSAFTALPPLVRMPGRVA